VAVAGCGSVSGPYLADLSRSPSVELASVCDIDGRRARARAAEFNVPHAFDDVGSLLRRPDFDLLINLTPMPEHYPVNLQALQAGKHVLSEKPIATSLADAEMLLETARERGVRLFGAPNVVTSPAFRCLAEIAGSGRIGRVFVAHGHYGHTGPGWGPWFYRKGGGSLFDLGVYNITTLTGILGPARSVVALSGTAIPERIVEGERVTAEADDNTMLLMDHGSAVFSSVTTGFVYGSHREDRTVDLIGTQGSAYLRGWDWQPAGVELWTQDRETPEVLGEDQEGYRWEGGGSYVAECLATGRPSLMTAEHALHVLEVMLAAHESAARGQRVAVTSRFPWPLFGAERGDDVPDADRPTGLDPNEHRR
jgi:predicted dehydrogenase